MPQLVCVGLSAPTNAQQLTLHICLPHAHNHNISSQLAAPVLTCLPPCLGPSPAPTPPNLPQNPGLGGAQPLCWMTTTIWRALNFPVFGSSSFAQIFALQPAAWPPDLSGFNDGGPAIQPAHQVAFSDQFKEVAASKNSNSQHGNTTRQRAESNCPSTKPSQWHSHNKKEICGVTCCQRLVALRKFENHSVPSVPIGNEIE